MPAPPDANIGCNGRAVQPGSYNRGVQTTPQIVTVTLNTAVDRVIEAPGFAVGAHLRGRMVSRYPAGKAINVSRALARLGRSSIATGFVGQEEASMFDRFLAGAGPGRTVGQLLAVRGRTRENITIIDPQDHTDTHIRDEGFEVLEHDVQRMQVKLALLSRPGTIMVISGSLPPGLSADVFRELLAAAQDGGARLLVDVEGGLLKPVLARLSRPLWHVSLNRAELAQWAGHADVGDDAGLVRAARSINEQALHVTVTAGPEGAWLVTADGAWRGRAENLPPIANTVGCGDCFVAGLIDAHLHRRQLPQTLQSAIGVATANAVSTGVAEFDEADVQRWEQETRISPA
jgi:1-phosphofructokinase family hexose kinase